MLKAIFQPQPLFLNLVKSKALVDKNAIDFYLLKPDLFLFLSFLFYLYVLFIFFNDAYFFIFFFLNNCCESNCTLPVFYPFAQFILLYFNYNLSYSPFI